MRVRTRLGGEGTSQVMIQYVSLAGTELGERVLKELMALMRPNAPPLAGSELREVAERAGIPRTTHSRLLRKLVKLGMVRQYRGFDGRTRYYVITSRGEELASYLSIDLLERILEECRHYDLSALLEQYGGDVRVKGLADLGEPSDYVAVSKECVKKFGDGEGFPNIIEFLTSGEKGWRALLGRLGRTELLILLKPKYLREVLGAPRP